MMGNKFVKDNVDVNFLLDFEEKGNKSGASKSLKSFLFRLALNLSLFPPS